MNLTLANKNPFSTFDFLGYFFPGSFALFLCYILGDIEFANDEIPHSIKRFHSLFVSHELLGIFFFVIMAYITGHLLSYLSSVTIERYFVWSNGYPTDYLLSRRNNTGILASNCGILGGLWHALVCIFIAPITICSSFFERLLGLSFFITKGLDDEIKKMIEIKIKDLPKAIGLSEDFDTTENTDIHRIVMHFVYEYCQLHNVKFDNYVALYGFLRSLSLIFNICFVFQFLRLCNSYSVSCSFCNCTCSCLCDCNLGFLLVSIIISGSLTYLYLNIKSNKENYMDNIVILFFSLLLMSLFLCYIIKGGLTTIPNGDIVLLLTTLVACYLSYLGFAKFYRRFTLENYMSFLIFKGNKENKENGGKQGLF